MNPITREESLLDGQDLTPITRKEQFIKRIYDKTQEVPTPITREEYFLKKAGESTSPVAVEQLNVTENGTYSETGKAYSPVIVEVPAPTLITKTITENGTYTASSDNADGYSQVTVNVPYMEKKSASGDIASFSDGAGYPFLKVKANINPVQDLHGYDYPWVGGAGKNKLPPLQSEQEMNGVKFTPNADGSIVLTGTASGGNAAVDLGRPEGLTLPAGEYVASGAGSSQNVTFEVYGIVSGTISMIRSGLGAFTLTQTTGVFIRAFVTNGSTVSGTMYPQIESGSSATTYAPYSNICPISGFTGVNVTVSPTTTEGSGTVYPISWQDEAGIVYGGYIDLVSGVLTVTKVGIAEYNGETLPSAWISDRDRYVAGNTPTIGAQVVYDLATPQTYQLTPQQINTLIGQNNVWNNTNGQTEVEYFIPIE